MQMFGEFDEWSIAIFDNILLLLAHDEADACRKLRTFLERCEKQNVFLKMPKSWFGSPSVKFFGYKKLLLASAKWTKTVRKLTWSLRCPVVKRRCKAFWGQRFSLSLSCLTIAYALNKLTHKDFDWKRDTWKHDYEADFELMKKALSQSVANHFPDNNLDRVLRVDASDEAVGAVLYQERPDELGVVHELIGFASQKFSSIA